MQGSDEIFRIAQEEIRREDERKAINEVKRKLRKKERDKRWWHHLIPFTIKIERRK